MVAKDILNNESGQSVLEFFVTMPIVIALAILMVHINQGIQVSIVNQKYARMHTLWLTFNSPIYPEKIHRRSHAGESEAFNQMLLGVSENTAEDEGDEEYQPAASTQLVARNRTLAGSETSQAGEEPTERAWVRVRTTVSLCTQTNVVSAGGGIKPVSSATMREGITPQNFLYCRSPVQ